ALLALSILSVYYQVRDFDFIYFDDPKYVRDNPIVGQGITRDSVRWAFLSLGYASNWHPVTWISHMFDVEIFGLNPGMHHLTNVFFHIANSILVFLVFFRLTGARGKSAVVAALFALHPLHVESVAWVSERKDVLSALFWMLTLWAYLGYVRYRGVARYLLVATLYALGLMAKPMLVTLPFVLLLLDFWPIRRAELVVPEKDPSTKQESMSSASLRWSGLVPLVVEKIPLFILSGISSWITYLAQTRGGALRSFELLPLGTRMINSVVSYSAYLWKTLWPLDLAFFYPYPEMLNPILVAGSALLLVTVTLVAFVFRKRFPFLLVGWLWYVGALVPVIGIVQVGDQSMADRYTYLPLIGIFLMLVWGVSSIVESSKTGRAVLVSAGIVVLSALSAATWVQVGYWKDSKTLFTHALNVTQNNHLAHTNLSAVLLEQGDVQEAIYHATEALNIQSGYVPAMNNRGFGLLLQGKYEEAVHQFTQALDREPNYITAHYNTGLALYGMGRVDKAIRSYERVLELDPQHAGARRGKKEAYIKQQEINERIIKVRQSIKDEPNNSILLYTLAEHYRMIGRTGEAMEVYDRALSIDPDMIPALFARALVYTESSEYDKALSSLYAIARLRPDDPDVDYNIACIYAKQGRVDDGVRYLKQALDKGFSNVDLLESDPDLENIRETEGFKQLLEELNQ
ncbi:MAG: tetratricopeptide repeat protein, partial [Desulfomonilia bacterium]|nr:tetratricopeptide repeat protein [Desulfomonilia bacterium]